MDEDLRQQIKDEEHLRLLSLGYMISAGITAVFSIFGLMYIFMGLMFTSLLTNMPNPKPSQAPPAFIGWIFVIMGLGFLLIGCIIAVLKWQVGRCLKQRHCRTFCYVVAGISCLSIPYGTLLGIFTFITLGRQSVSKLFHTQA